MGQLGSNILEKETAAWYKMPAMEIFPVSLSIVHAAGFKNHLSDETIKKLRNFEEDLLKNVDVSSILLASSEKEMEDAFENALPTAIEYYMESGIVIWRSLEHDYKKLLKLTQVSCQLIDNLFFQNARQLDRDIFTNSVASVRVLNEVGKRVTLAEEHTPPEKQTVPFEYLTQVMLSTFILWCILSFVQGNVKKVSPVNVKMLSDSLFSISKKVYREALKKNIFTTEAEISFWDPDWQKGEVEVDLDKHFGAVKAYQNIDDLINGLSHK
jgi:hypothetical protein